MPGDFSLARTCAPAAWAGGRWPNEDWIDGAFWWTGHDSGAHHWRTVRAVPGGIEVQGSGDETIVPAWAMRVLSPRSTPFAGSDPVVSAIEAALPGTGSLNNGDMADGMMFSIIGQSVSLASVGVTATRFAARFHEGFRLAGRTLWPLPTPEQVADSQWEAIQPCGVTGKRAQALVSAATLFARGDLPRDPAQFTSEHAAALLGVSGIGPWTVASTLLWGGGDPDVYPPGDAALLRAARTAYGEPDLDYRSLEIRSTAWGPERAVAARLLWTNLFGHPEDRFTESRPPRKALA